MDRQAADGLALCAPPAEARAMILIATGRLSKPPGTLRPVYRSQRNHIWLRTGRWMPFVDSHIVVGVDYLPPHTCRSIVRRRPKETPSCPTDRSRNKSPIGSFPNQSTFPRLHPPSRYIYPDCPPNYLTWGPVYCRKPPRTVFSSRSAVPPAAPVALGGVGSSGAGVFGVGTETVACALATASGDIRFSNASSARI